MSWSHQHNLVLEYFHFSLPPKNPYLGFPGGSVVKNPPVNAESPYPLVVLSDSYFPQPWTLCLYQFACSEHFIYMKSYNTVFFVCEWLFSLNIFKGHLCCRMYWYFIPFYCLVLLHSMAVSHSEFFHFLASMNNAAVNICVQGLVWTYVFVFLGCIPRSGVAEPHGNSMFNFLRNCFPKWLPQFTLPLGLYEGSNSSCSLQHLIVLIISSLMGLKSYLVVILICKFFCLMTNDVGYVLTFLLIVCVSSFEKCLFVSFGSFFDWVTFHYRVIFTFLSHEFFIFCMHVPY